jgi:hypothetical protein
MKTMYYHVSLPAPLLYSSLIISAAPDYDITVAEAKQVPVLPLTPSELQDIAERTPSCWDQIEPIVPEKLPLADAGTSTDRSDESKYAYRELLKYPYNTVQPLDHVLGSIQWKARRGGDMAMIAGPY